MKPEELARRINKLLARGINTTADKEECLRLDRESGEFIGQATVEEYIIFKKLCPALEAFAMIAAGLMKP